MLRFLIWMLVGVAVFGVALTFAVRKIKEVKVEPRSAIPLVALVFGVLNALLYAVIAFTVKLVTLWTLAIVAPFVANALLLWATDKLLRKYFEIDGLVAFVKLAGLMTLAHLLLQVAKFLIPA